MPRITVMIATAGAESAREGDNRNRAHTKPSSVESTKAASISSTVTTQPCRRIGRKSRASRRNACIYRPRASWEQIAGAVRSTA